MAIVPAAALAPSGAFLNSTRPTLTSTRRRFASLIVFGLSALAACGGDGLVLPDESRPAKIAIIAGDSQAAPAGATLQPIVVKVTDALDRPVEGQTVAFTIDAGGGQVAPPTAVTGSDGHASATWTLGGAAGQQRVQAQVSGDDLLVKFIASAMSGVGALIEPVSGDNQTAAVGSALPDSLVVRVMDEQRNPVAGVEVQWTVTGGGSISPVTVVSGADGTAAAERVLGNASGTQGAQAAATGIGSVTFTQTAEAANPTTLVLVSGDAQSGAAGAPLADSLVVRLVDDNGNGVGGKAVSWVVGTGGGSVAPTTSTTNPNGLAWTRWTLGPSAGSNLLNAVFSGVPSVPFTATAQAGTATKLAFTQVPVTTSAGSSITPAVRVAIQDASGNTVTSANGDVTVAIGVNPGGGVLSGTTTVSAVNGVATFANLSIDKTGTGYTLGASSPGLAGLTSPEFDILTGSANRLVFLTGPTDRVVGEKFAPALQVQVQDAGGNPVLFAGAITLTSSVTGSLSGTATASPFLGTATFSNLAINKAGTDYTLTALSSGVSSATSSPFDVAQASTTTTIASKTPSGVSVVGQPVTFNYDVNVVAPGAGTLTGTVTVTDGTQSCNGSISAGAGTGSCSIAFTSPGDRSVSATYSGDLNFESSTTTSSTSHTVNKANTSLVVSSDDPDASLIDETVTVEWTLAATGAGAGTPTGTISVTASGSAGCTSPASFGTGSCDLTFATIGTFTITATYPGDANFNASSFNAQHTVKGATSTTVVSSGTPSSAGQDVTFTAQVTATSGTGNPSGQVRFFDGSTQIGQDNVNGSGSASIDLALAEGSHSITASYQGSSTFTGSTSSPITQVVEPGNGTPIAGADSYGVDEGGSLTVLAATGVLANDDDPDNDDLTAVLGDGPDHAQIFNLNPDGSFTYKPAADFNGSDGFSYHATDGALSSGTVIATITVAPVNDAPSFTGSNVTWSAGGGAYSLPWASGSAGPPDEGGQTLSYVTSVDGLGALLFIDQPAVSPEGILSFTPLGLPGAATITVHVEDDGGTAAGGDDTSDSQDFTITLN